MSNSSRTTTQTSSSLDPRQTQTTRSNRAPQLVAWRTPCQVYQICSKYRVWMASAVISSETTRTSRSDSISTSSTTQTKRLCHALTVASTSAESSIASATHLCSTISRQAMCTLINNYLCWSILWPPTLRISSMMMLIQLISSNLAVQGQIQKASSTTQFV